MAISTQTQNLNLIPGKSAPVVVHLSQGNIGNTISFNLYDGDAPFYPVNVSIAVHGLRANGSMFGPYEVTSSPSSNTVSFNVNQDMTAVYGAAVCELVVTDVNQNQVGTANFGMLVEEAPFSSSVVYEDDLSIYQRILAFVQSYRATILNDINNETIERRSEIAAEVSARTAADANLQSQINQYVVPSSEQPTEVVNARVGADGTTYPTLKSRLDSEHNSLKVSTGVEAKTTIDVAPTSYTLPAGAERWFMQGIATGLLKSIQLYFRQAGSATIEVWKRISGGNLVRIFSTTETVSTNYTTRVILLNVSSDDPMYVSVIPSDAGVIGYNNDSHYSTFHIQDVTSTTLIFSTILVFKSMGITGHMNYVTSKVDNVYDDVENLSDAFKFREHMTVNVPGSSVTYPGTGSTRWFMQGVASGVITAVTLQFRLAGSVIIEVWARTGNTLTRISLMRETCETDYTMKTIPMRVYSDYPMYVSIIPTAASSIGYNRSNTYETMYSEGTYPNNQIDMSTVFRFSSMGVSGYISYSSKDSSTEENGLVKRYSGGGVSYYDTISSAVNDAIDGDTIIASPGVYSEAISAWGKTISIIGEDKYGCIIKNSTANYETPAVEIDSGRLANFTIISDGLNPTLDSSSEYYMKDYCIHVEHPHGSDKELLIEDCIIKNNHRTALGIGLYPNNTVTIRNCDIWSAAPPNDIQDIDYNRRGALYFHNRSSSEYWSNVPNQRIRVIGCTIYCEDVIALYVGVIPKGDPSWVNDTEAEFINNMICAKDTHGNYKTSSDGISTPPGFTQDSVIGGAEFTSDFRLSKTSYGNNLSHLNYGS